MINGLFQKKTNRDWGYTFLNPSPPPWNFQICYFTLRNSRENKLLSLEILQNCVTPLGNSKVKNQDLCYGNSTWFFLEHQWKFLFFFHWPLEFPHVSFFNTSWTGLVKLGVPRGPWPSTFFQSKKKKKNNNCNKLKIHNITSWIGQSICYYLDFIWFSPFAYVCKACTFFSCYYYRIQLFYSYKI